jgi:hypothetical protein
MGINHASATAASATLFFISGCAGGSSNDQTPESRLQYPSLTTEV